MIVGHTAVRARLRAMKGRVPPSLLLAGPEGIGRKLVALEFAREITGETRALDLSVSMSQTESLFFVAPDGASIKIEQVREAMQFLNLARDGKPLFVIFDQAHLLGPQAANALLKSVEEPPPGVHFIFITPSPALMLSTIRSRSQVVSCAPLLDTEVEAVVRAVLKNVDGGFKVEPWLIQMAAGSPGLALEMLNSSHGASDGFSSVRSVVERLVDACGPDGDFTSRTESLIGLRESLKDRDLHLLALRFLVREMNSAWRHRASNEKLTPGAKSGDKSSSASWLGGLSFESLDLATDLALEAEADLARNVDRQLLWEAFAARLCLIR